MYEHLGRKGTDRITGFSGVITGHAEYISGCNQTLLVPKVDPTGKYVDGQWFDDQRVTVDNKTNKVVLDNTRTPGPDREAPKQ